MDLTSHIQNPAVVVIVEAHLSARRVEAGTSKVLLVGGQADASQERISQYLQEF